MTRPGIWLRWPGQVTGRDPASRLVGAVLDEPVAPLVATAPNNDLRPYVPEHDRVGGAAGRRPKVREDDLLCDCWCGAAIVWVTADDVGAGRTKSCRRPSCTPGRQLTRVRRSAS